MLHRSPCTLELWNHWIQHSDELIAMPPFLDTSHPHPDILASLHPPESPPLQDTQHISLGGAVVQNLQSMLGNYMFDSTMDDLPLSDILIRMRLSAIPTQCNGLIYTGFPPEGFHDSRTALWFY